MIDPNIEDQSPIAEKHSKKFLNKLKSVSSKYSLMDDLNHETDVRLNNISNAPSWKKSKMHLSKSTKILSKPCSKES